MTYRTLSTVCLLGLALLCGCGGGSSAPPTSSAPLTSNWQWTMDDPLNQGGITGGFLQQKGNSITGSLAYLIFPPEAGASACAGGSAPVTGTLDGQTVTLTAVAGAQTYIFTGTLATTAGGSTLVGTYTSSDGAPLPNGGTCGTGTGQQSLNWSAISVAPLTGTFQGSFHSTSVAVGGQDFPVSGTLTQGENIGADSATVTGAVSIPGYPCLSHASLNGTISGSSVILSIIGDNGLAVGSIGSPSISGLAPTPAVLQLGGNGRVLLARNISSTGGYQVTTKSCPLFDGGGSTGDSGNVCLALGTANTCGAPISFSPTTLAFPPQVLGTPPTTQPITLTNTDPLSQPQTLTLALQSPSGQPQGDFNQQPHFTEQDTCGPSPFTLGPNQSCTIFISFSPQESCPWNPNAVPPVQCPFTLTGTLSVQTANNPLDGDPQFNVPIAGTGLSAIIPSTAELDFGPEDPSAGEESDPQWITFTNQASYPVQVLPSGSCVSPFDHQLVPGTEPGLVAVNFQGFQESLPDGTCDTPPPDSEFPFTIDNCSGITLQPQQVCTVSIASKPRVGSLLSAINYLELNTVPCVFPQQPGPTSPCEIDAGRFPVALNRQLRANSIRLMPAASLTFDTQAVGSTSASQSITVFNDPNDSSPGDITFQSIVSNGDYAQTNTCGSSLARGQSCTITVTFKPTGKGLRQGTVVITVPITGGATIFLRGKGK